MTKRWSRYNLSLDCSSSSHIVFNTRSGTCGRVPPDLSQATPAELEILLRSGLVVDHEMDEAADVIASERASRLNAIPAFAVSIAPTLKCNAACKYCYEANPDTKTQQAGDFDEVLESFTRRVMEEKSRLRVLWYGGEPLIEFDRIRRLSEIFISICGAENFSASIITNGTLLDSRRLQILRNECLVKEIQVTIDGTADIHNQRRPMKDKSDGFTRIIENIESSFGVIPVTIRVNVDQENVSALNDLLRFLIEDRQWKPEYRHILFHPVFDRALNGDLLKTGHWYAQAMQIIARDWLLDLSTMARNQFIPIPTIGACGAWNVNAIVVDPSLYVYRCWEDVGIPVRSIGRLQNYEPGTPLPDLEIPTSCNDCIYLPSCFGGCMTRRALNENQAICPALKDLFVEFLNVRYGNTQQGIT